MKTKRVNARYGNYRGIVIDNLDPLNKGRIKIFVPGVYPKDFEANPDKLPWAEPAMPIFGGGWTALKDSNNKETGFNSVPHAGKKGDGAQVWVFFDDGDIRYPIYFAVSQSGPGWFSKHSNQHVFTTDNISIVIDEFDNLDTASSRAVSEAEQKVASAKAKIEEAESESEVENGGEPPDMSLYEDLDNAEKELANAQKQQQKDADKVVTKVSPYVSPKMDVQAATAGMNQSRMKTRLKISIITKEPKKDCGVDLNIKGNVNLRIEGNVYKEIYGDIIEYHEGSYRLHRTGPTVEITNGSTRTIKRGKINWEEFDGSVKHIVKGQREDVCNGRCTEIVLSDKELVLGSLKSTIKGPVDLTYTNYSETVFGTKTVRVAGSYDMIGINQNAKCKIVFPYFFVNAGALGHTANVIINNAKNLIINNVSSLPIKEGFPNIVNVDTTTMVGLNNIYGKTTTVGVINTIGIPSTIGLLLNNGVYNECVGANTTIIGGTLTKTVTGAATYDYNGAVTNTIAGAVTNTIGGALTNTITGLTTYEYNGGLSETITGVMGVTASGLTTIAYNGGANISGVNTINFKNGNNTQTITIGSITATVGSTTYTVVWEPPPVARA